jgi:hypothetical protein
MFIGDYPVNDFSSEHSGPCCGFRRVEGGGGFFLGLLHYAVPLVWVMARRYCGRYPRLCIRHSVHGVDTFGLSTHSNIHLLTMVLLGVKAM